MIDILLATYNGERYLAEQLESLLHQTEQDFCICAQDDGSTDGTPALLKAYEQRYPGKIRVWLRKEGGGGAAANFFDLLRLSEADYAMFCDQDDVWMAQKVEQTLKKMKETENGDVDVPVLVHTDAVVADEDLRVLDGSLFHMQRLDAGASAFSRLLVQNIVTGCTVMMNRALVKRLGEHPQGAVMHDWWCALLAAAFGRIAFLQEATMYYRQHAANKVGAKQAGKLSYNLGRLRDAGGARQVLEATVTQAQAFLTQYGDELEEEKRRALRAYCALPEEGKLRRIRTLFQYGLWKQGLFRRAGQLWYV
jgi:glycosyltransferase involved in cell wall biosynthesis